MDDLGLHLLRAGERRHERAQRRGETDLAEATHDRTPLLLVAVMLDPFPLLDESFSPGEMPHGGGKPGGRRYWPLAQLVVPYGAKEPMAGAGLDVFDQEPPPLDHPIFTLDNVILSPHNAGLSKEAAIPWPSLPPATRSPASTASAIRRWWSTGRCYSGRAAPPNYCCSHDLRFTID